MSVGSYSTETWSDGGASVAFYIDDLKLDLIKNIFDVTEGATPPSAFEAGLRILRENRTRQRELLIQFDALSSLRSGWDSYGAEAPGAGAINRTGEALLEFVKAGLLPTRLVPSAEGGVGMIFSRADKYADIEFLNSGETLGARYQGHQRPEVWDASDIGDAVRRLVAFFGH